MPEIALTLLGLFALTLALTEVDAFEKVHNFTRAHEAYELDEIITALFASPIILLVFSIRRVRDLKREVKRRKTAETDLSNVANFDTLTGLASRKSLFNALQQRLVSVSDEDQGFSLFQISIDRFKHVNDRLGPVAGDHILKHVSRQLSNVTKSSWLLSRIGGDEFLILAEIRTDKAAKEYAAKLVELLNQSISYDETTCSITASVGLVTHDNSSHDAVRDPETLLINADIALHRAQDNGRNRFEVFENSLKTDFVRKTTLSNELLQAVARNEFFAVYQPLVEASTRQIVGAEALLRWQHPERGVLAPSEFMEQAQQLGLLADIDQMMFEEAVKRQKSWKARLPRAPRISVNVSAERLKSPVFLETLHNARIQPDTIIFEISEAVTFEQLDDVSRFNLDALCELGIDVEIDDFGSGRASILSLLEMRPRRLKIDRNLTAPITRSEQSLKLIGSILEIARSLGIEVVAEGVETGEHAEILTQYGCTILQGYHFSRPVTATAFEQLLLKEDAASTQIERVAAPTAAAS